MKLLMRYFAICALLCLVVTGCSSSAPNYISPGLDQIQETASNISTPVLHVTFPASWDENWYSSPAVYDIDKDGKNEIIASRHSVLYVWKLDSSLFWRAPVGENASSANNHGASRMYCSPVVGDLNNDGYGEIAISYDNQAAVYDYKGNLMPGWPQIADRSDKQKNDYGGYNQNI